MSKRITLAVVCAAALSTLAATAFGSTRSTNEVTLTCQRCEASPSDVFSQTMAALQATAAGDDPILVMTPADQTVTDAAAFGAALQRAIAADEERLRAVKAEAEGWLAGAMYS